jgi:predicted S18 family serine protease
LRKRKNIERFAVLIILLTIFYVIAPIITEASSVLSIYAPAVTNSGGAVIKIYVDLSKNGSGKLQIKGVPNVGNDTLYSSLVAFYISLLLNDRNPMEYSGTISFESGLAGIEGPSASLGIAEAFYILSSEVQAPVLINSTVITGAIGPDGLSIMVGGVPEKFTAACISGASAFALPISNYLNADFNQSHCEKIRIIPTSGIISLYSQLNGYNFTNFNTVGAFFYPSQVSEEMGKAALDYINRSVELDSSFYNSSSYADIISALNMGKNYTAASLALSAYVLTLQKTLMKNLTKLADVRKYFSYLNATYQVEIERLKSTEKEISSRTQIPVPVIETLSTAESRLWQAKKYIEEGESAGNISIAIQYAANAFGRMMASETWIDLSTLDWSDFPHVEAQQFLSSLNDYASFVQAALYYTEALIQGSESQALMLYYSNLHHTFILASSLNATDELFFKYALLSELNSDISSTLLSMNLQEETSVPYYISEAYRVYTVIYSNLIKNGLVTTITPTYIEYSSYKGLDDESKLMLIDNAISWSLPLLFLSFHSQSFSEHFQLHTQFPIESLLSSVFLVWTFAGILASLISIAVYRSIRRAL